MGASKSYMWMVRDQFPRPRHCLVKFQRARAWATSVRLWSDDNALQHTVAGLVRGSEPSF